MENSAGSREVNGWSCDGYFFFFCLFAPGTGRPFALGGVFCFSLWGFLLEGGDFVTGGRGCFAMVWDTRLLLLLVLTFLFFLRACLLGCFGLLFFFEVFHDGYDTM